MIQREAVVAKLQAAQDAFNRGELDEYLMLYAPDAHFHFFPPDLPQGRDGARLFYQSFLASFPDAALNIEETIVEGGKSASRFWLTATQSGEFNGVPASGKSVKFTGMTMMAWREEEVVERWNEADFLGLMQQIGAIPIQGAA